ncbi:MAG: hypothetical protein R6V03_03155 [Kiritimatiellia bacterium]
MARRRNRKKTDGFAFPARFTGLVICLSVVALAYVWLCCRCEAVGKEIKELERENGELRQRYTSEVSRWARMISPRNMELVLARNNLRMHWPRVNQIVWMHEDREPDHAASVLADNAVTYVRYDESVMND